MSKKNARSWKLVVASTALMVMAGVLVLNVGASANVTGSGPLPLQSPSGSTSPRPSGSASTQPSPEDTCEPIPPPICENESPSASPKPSTSASPTPDPGGDEAHKAKITIDYSNKKDSFTGKVDSKAICVKARRVDLFKVAPGKDQNSGHSLTNNKGKYRIPFPNAKGRFYTKARKFEPDRNTTCKGATSKTISP